MKNGCSDKGQVHGGALDGPLTRKPSPQGVIGVPGEGVSVRAGVGGIWHEVPAISLQPAPAAATQSASLGTQRLPMGQAQVLPMAAGGTFPEVGCGPVSC